MKRLEIRIAKAKDAEMIASLSAMTFWDTYRDNPNVDVTNIKAYMSKAFTIEKITKELADGNTIFLIAEDENQQIGYAKLLVGSRESIISSERPLEISRIYLKREFFGKGFGSILLQQCLDRGKQEGCDSVWLSVWQHNQRAIKFYKKKGFENIGTHIFHLASLQETDFIMERKIDK